MILASFQSSTETRIYLFGNLFLKPRYDMRVCVEGELRGGVPQSRTHDLWMCAIQEQLSGMTVPQIMKPNMRQPRLAQEHTESLRESSRRPWFSVSYDRKLCFG